jgi:hypothetical protein
MRWARNVAGIAEIRNAYIILVRVPGGKRIRGDAGINGRIILNWILKNYSFGVTYCLHHQD